MPTFDALKRARKHLKQAPFPQLLGMRFTRLEPGRATLRMNNSNDKRQYRGQTHGGAITALVDSAATFATNSLIGEHHDSVTVELKVNFLKAGKGRYLDAHAEVVHHGRTTSISKVEVLRADGVMCALATVTNFVYNTEG